jgi:hypothetical protein
MRRRDPSSSSKEESKGEGAPELTLAKVPEQESLGFGFVSYTTIEAASRARGEAKVKPLKG